MTSPESILPGPYIQLATALGGAILAATWLSLILWTARDIRARSDDRLAQILAVIAVALLNHPRSVSLSASAPFADARGRVSIQPGRRSADLDPRRADDLPRLRPAGGTRLADLPGLLDRPAQTLHRLRADARSHLERVPVLRDRDRRQGNRNTGGRLINPLEQGRGNASPLHLFRSSYPNPPFLKAAFPA